VAAQSVEALTTPGFGMATDAGLSREGFRNVLSLPAEMAGQWGGVAPDPQSIWMCLMTSGRWV